MNALATTLIMKSTKFSVAFIIDIYYAFMLNQ